mmetsp:Transcript_9714/g.40768  ORF Transcript_9714/g.40768 Transcript_9714/m.40768 type:complete len:307 (-) Transcript_9714:410-1330(-)
MCVGAPLSKCASWYHPSSWYHFITATYASPNTSSASASPKATYALRRYSKNESQPAPMPPLRLIQRPVLTSMVFPSKSLSDLLDHRALMARFEACSNRQSPVMRDRAPNSSAYDPTAATLVSAVSPERTPKRRLTHAYGIPVSVSKAFSNRSPRSSANPNSSPLYPETTRLVFETNDALLLWSASREVSARAASSSSRAVSDVEMSPAAMACAESKPPRARMLHSNAFTRTSWSKLRCLDIHRTFLANSEWFPRTASVLVASINVSATPRYVELRCSRRKFPSSPSESVYDLVRGFSSSCGNACRR